MSEPTFLQSRIGFRRIRVHLDNFDSKRQEPDVAYAHWWGHLTHEGRTVQVEGYRHGDSERTLFVTDDMTMEYAVYMNWQTATSTALQMVVKWPEVQP
ncbi:MAG: hypothetical protein IPM06_19920 [Rhizobiales bacterium]|nr:hypothetical protein [Hyphomicrobiales bacterium]